MKCYSCNKTLGGSYWKVGSWVFHDFKCCKSFVEDLKNVPVFRLSKKNTSTVKLLGN